MASTSSSCNKHCQFKNQHNVGFVEKYRSIPKVSTGRTVVKKKKKKDLLCSFCRLVFTALTWNISKLHPVRAGLWMPTHSGTILTLTTTKEPCFGDKTAQIGKLAWLQQGLPRLCAYKSPLAGSWEAAAYDGFSAEHRKSPFNPACCCLPLEP